MPSLKIAGASVGYHDRPILRDISLVAEPGEVLAVVGPNSVGKSTLIKGASGILPLFKGTISVGDKDLHQIPPEERARLVAVVPQAVNLPAAFTAFDVVMLGRTPYLRWLGREGEADRNLAIEAMRRTSTLELADRPVGELSGGEQQRVMIARSLTQASKVLLLDEPTAHLDLKHQDEILKLVRSLADDERLTVLITLHDLNLVARYADRVALLSAGKVRSVGLPAEVLVPEELATVYGIALHVAPHPLSGTPLVLYED
jgi:iron complex transport system ATP-binding protein